MKVPTLKNAVQIVCLLSIATTGGPTACLQRAAYRTDCSSYGYG